MKTAGVRDLKTRLSAYLRDVADGEIVLVTDRGRVVAELRPPGAGLREVSPEELRRQRLIDRGVLRAATDPDAARALASLPTLRLPAGTARELLDAEREE